MNKTVPFFLLSLFLSPLCGYAQDNTIIKEDKLVKEIAIPPFEAVAMGGGGDFYFHYASDTKVALKGTDPCLENMVVQVSSNTLTIHPKAGFAENCRIEIHVYAPLIKEIQLNGGGAIEIMEGFAPVEAFTCSLDGGGTVKMTALKVDSLFASLEGGGEISARVNKLIQGKIKGGGVVFYQGEPAVESDISGGGVIKRKRDEN